MFGTGGTWVYSSRCNRNSILTSESIQNICPSHEKWGWKVGNNVKERFRVGKTLRYIRTVTD